jgi:hypothetical protein
VSDADCSNGDLCIAQYDQSCEVCVDHRSLTCQTAADCRYMIATDECCRCPYLINSTYATKNPCLVDYPQTGPSPTGCVRDCTGVNHCWPCQQLRPVTLTCNSSFGGPLMCGYQVQ